MGKKRKSVTRKKKIRRQRGGGSPFFQDAYTITLDSHPERWKRMSDFATKAGIDLKKWPGIVIKKEELDTLPPQGVGTTTYKDRSGKIFNLGVIGAFLAHRNLYNHIVKEGGGKMGTFISEDDIHIEPDFYTKLAAVEKEIPADWDIIFLDKNIPTVQGKKISEHVVKLDKDITATKNWGIWSYIIKNSSVATKVLPCMEHMMDVPDIQLARFADRINMYLISPSITFGDPDTAFKSVVTENDTK
jgi:GR25 family glycosyltransferase involved in LPS biosynthesis